MKPPYDGLIFDMDGVLIDVSRSYLQAIRQTASYFLQEPVTDDMVARIKKRVDMNNDWDATYALIHDSSLAFSTVKDYFQQLYLGDENETGLMKLEQLLIPRTKLILLRSQYGKMGIATGRPREEALAAIQQHGLEGVFDVVVALEDCPRAKPAPDPIQLVINQLQLTDTVYIGDSPGDVSAASAAGIPCLYVGALDIGTKRFETPLEVCDFLL